jgi:hypothetical protein
MSQLLGICSVEPNSTQHRRVVEKLSIWGDRLVKVESKNYEEIDGKIIVPGEDEFLRRATFFLTLPSGSAGTVIQYKAAFAIIADSTQDLLELARYLGLALEKRTSLESFIIAHALIRRRPEIPSQKLPDNSSCTLCPECGSQSLLVEDG